MLAYYPVQVEKALDRFEQLVRELGEESVWAMCDEEDKESLKTYLEHGRLIIACLNRVDRQRLINRLRGYYRAKEVLRVAVEQ